MKKDLFDHRIHFKMYKAGKYWLVAGLLVTGLLIEAHSSSFTTVQADAAISGQQLTTSSSASDEHVNSVSVSNTSSVDIRSNVSSVSSINNSMPNASSGSSSVLITSSSSEWVGSNNLNNSVQTLSNEHSSISSSTTVTDMQASLAQTTKSQSTSSNIGSSNDISFKMGDSNSNVSSKTVGSISGAASNQVSMSGSTQTVNNEFADHNAIYAPDSNNITNVDGFLTANSWYRPKDILNDGQQWVPSTSTDFRPLLMTWWPDKTTQVNYLNYMQTQGYSNQNYNINDDANTLLQATQTVQGNLERQITNDQGNVDWLHTLTQNFVKTQPMWNRSSEDPVNDGLQGGSLLFNNNSLTPDANSNDRKLNQGDLFEFLLGSDIDNSNPVVQAENLNWLYYLTNLGSITQNNSNANFDGIRMDAVGDIDADVLNLTSQYMNDAYGMNQNDANANAHLSILENGDHYFYPNQRQLFIDYLNKTSLTNAPGSRNSLSTLINDPSGLVDRSQDSSENQAIPNYSFVHSHDTGVQYVITQIIKDKIDPNFDGIHATTDEFKQALQYYQNDINTTNKQYTYYNVPAAYALLLTNKDTVPRVYYGDMYNDGDQFMQSETPYYSSIEALLKARVQYVSGGQAMQTTNDGVLASVRYGKGAMTANDVGDSMTRQSGLAVVESNDPNANPDTVTINMGAAHQNQTYRPLMLSTSNGLQIFDQNQIDDSNQVTTDDNGDLVIDAKYLRGVSNPQVSGNLSIWIPADTPMDQDVRTSPSTTSHADGNVYHSNAALDSNVIFEAFSSFQPQPTDPSQYTNVILQQRAGFLKQLGFTSIELAPQYRSTTGNSFLDEILQNGYAFSDRYDLGYDQPTKYGTITQLTNLIDTLHQNGMQVMADVVANQLYLKQPQVVSANRVDLYGHPYGNTTINNDLYYANTIGGGPYQTRYGGEFLAQLQNLYPDLFTIPQHSTGVPIDPTVKIKHWSAKYLNGVNIQGVGSDYILRNVVGNNNQYFMVSDRGTYLPSQLLGGSFQMGFVNQNGTTNYYSFSGQPVNDAIVVDQGQRYYLDAQGNLMKGAFISNDNQHWYYADVKDGHLLTGNHWIGNQDYEFTNLGVQLKGTWFSDNQNRWYYTDPNDGRIVTHFYRINGVLNYFDDQGAQIKNQYVTDGNNHWYYTDSGDGHVVTGFYHVNGTLNYFDSNGIQVKGQWLSDSNNNWYYADNNDGHLLLGTHWIGNQAYEFTNLGVQLKGSWFSDNQNRWYYTDPNDGHIVTHFYRINGGLDYFNDQGVQMKGQYVTDGNNHWYYTDPGDGHIVVGFVYVNGALNYFNDQGVQVKGNWIVDTNGNCYYADLDDGHLLIGLQTINNQLYYLNVDGTQLKGDRITINGQNYQADPNTGVLSVI